MQKDSTMGIDLKRKNRNNIYCYIHQNKCVTKQDIVGNLGLSLPTVTQNLLELSKQGLVTQNGSFGNTGGRRAQGYSIISDAKAAIGIDINKTHVSVVAIDLEGNVLICDRKYIAYQKENTYYKMVADFMTKQINELGLKEQQILGVGIGIQGIVASKGDHISYGPILNNTGEHLERIAEHIKYPSFLYHDADAAAFAEMWTADEIKNAVYLSLSTNLGGSVIIDRKIYTGKDCFGGKLEHMTLFPDGELCYCGKSGCADAYCAATVLMNSVSDERLETFFEQLEHNSLIHKQLWETYKKHLSILLNNIHMLFGCDIILGGYMGQYLSPYLTEIKEISYDRNSFQTKDDYIHLCKFQKEAIASGAALLLVDRFIKEI